mmetsp:Transcript_33335/g.68819  ORF Transcript_33335/g.68819 Transcript_33335/m.68819 type:complete len:160 (-) Transcript_33335:78-557(-)|eukprot:CAMPEP_0181342332 /NCGR_PEP_ID=MMETSP1101-20121128/30938_1 /TAXON_ID=46948 /ORGANISM="Rhodomonas abbreviata, Strain Caron Lab Isolate" /LENGTH=159 /DNA_ID=CAMNT_0023453771 /DNA_START=220 /DNA_END=699 /DNA_ORIENTATION=+
MIACITIISKDNNPVLLRVYGEGVEESKFHYISYCAIDLLEERERNLPFPGPECKQEERDRILSMRRSGMFLGLLYPVEDYKVYGYVMSTGVRLVIVVDENDKQDESMVVAFFKKVHGLYTDSASNPFYKAGQPLKNPKLDKDLADLVRLWNADAFASK